MPRQRGMSVRFVGQPSHTAPGMSVRFVGQPSHTAPKMHREISKEYLK